MKKDPFGFKYYKRLPKDWEKRGKLYIAEYVRKHYVEMDDTEDHRSTFRECPFADKFIFIIMNRDEDNHSAGKVERKDEDTITRRGRMKNENVTIEPRTAYAGVTLSARRIGCSREHLSKVLHGKRKANGRIKKALRRMGVEVK